MDPNTVRKIRKIVFNWQFITISILIHLILVTYVGRKTIFKRSGEGSDFTSEDGDGGFVSNDKANEPPAPPPPPQQTPQFKVNPTSAAPAMTAIAATNPTQSTFSLPTMVAPQIMPNAKALDKVAALPPPPKMSAGMTQEAAKAIASFTGGWSKGGGNQSGQPLKKRQFEFTAYLAKYSGGDWDSTIKYKDGKVFSGSLPNLLYVISKISADKIKAMAEPIPLDLSNWDEIIAKKPPFIFFTGHRDFVLTDKEIENLQKYLRMGGCIWGDSSLPGLRSRFDLAFRREMRRIVPDVDKNFEPLPPDHPVFTKTYFTEIKSIPPGINYYKEPIYALKVYGEVAIIYTANDYGDMWQIGLNEKGEIDERRDAQGNFVAFNPSILWNSDIYFRNISPSSLLASYKFGTNMIVHLMTRWEDKVRNVR